MACYMKVKLPCVYIQHDDAMYQLVIFLHPSGSFGNPPYTIQSNPTYGKAQELTDVKELIELKVSLNYSQKHKILNGCSS